MKTKFILLIFLQFNLKVFCQLPENLIETSVQISLNINNDSIKGIGFGTGFFYEDSLHMYLITAKHVIYNDAGNLASIYCNVNFYARNSHKTTSQQFKINLDGLKTAKKIKQNFTDDIIAIELGDFVRGKNINSTKFNKYVNLLDGEGSLLQAYHFNNTMAFDSTKIGNDVFLFGYPESVVGMNYDFYDYKRPLLRKGALAGKDIFKDRIIIDCFANPGNSGGPVIYIDEKYLGPKSYYLIGLLTEGVLYSGDGNTGYSIVEPIDKVLKIIYSN